jgi:hypothetical protein
MHDEMPQQIEFLGRQLDLLTAAGNLAAKRSTVISPKTNAGSPLAPETLRGAHPRHQLGLKDLPT